MAPRKRAAPPVEIVLTEEELAAVLRECPGSLPAPGGTFAVASPGSPGPPAAPPSLPPPEQRAWSLGVAGPGAVGDAIRRILDATTLDRGRRLKVPGSE